MKSSFLKNIITLITGTTLSQAILVLTSPILTRLYTPEEYGILAVYTSILNIVVIISGLRYELAIPLPSNDDQARNLFTISFQSNIVFALLSLVLIIILRDSIVEWTHIEDIGPLLGLIPLGILLLGTYKSFNYWAVRKKEFRKISKTKISQSISSVVIQVVSGFLNLGSMGLILGQIAGQSAGISLLSRKSKLGQVMFKLKNDLESKRQLIKHYKEFPLYDAPASLLNVLSIEMPQILFASLFSPSIAGFYLLSQKVLGVPVRIIGQSISQVFYGDMSKQIKNNSLTKTTLRIITILFGITIVPSTIILIFGPEIFVKVFGEEWYDAGRFSSVLIFSIAAQFVYSPISLILLATKGQRINFFLQITMLILKLVSLFIGMYHNNAFIAVIGITVSGSFVYVLGILIIFIRTRKLEKLNLLKDL